MCGSKQTQNTKRGQIESDLSFYLKGTSTKYLNFLQTLIEGMPILGIFQEDGLAWIP